MNKLTKNILVPLIALIYLTVSFGSLINSIYPDLEHLWKYGNTVVKEKKQNSKGKLVWTLRRHVTFPVKSAATDPVVIEEFKYHSSRKYFISYYYCPVELYNTPLLSFTDGRAPPFS